MYVYQIFNITKVLKKTFISTHLCKITNGTQNVEYNPTVYTVLYPPLVDLPEQIYVCGYLQGLGMRGEKQPD